MKTALEDLIYALRALRDDYTLGLSRLQVIDVVDTQTGKYVYRWTEDEGEK
jgi:hypothetical protein